jgi:hypothetical protein
MVSEPITVAVRSKAWTVFACLNTGIVGSNPTQGMDVCIMCLFCVCVLYLGRGLATGWSPVQESHRLRIGSRNRKNGQGPTKGCRAIIIIVWWIIYYYFSSSQFYVSHAQPLQTAKLCIKLLTGWNFIRSCLEWTTKFSFSVHFDSISTGKWAIGVLKLSL